MSPNDCSCYSVSRCMDNHNHWEKGKFKAMRTDFVMTKVFFQVVSWLSVTHKDVFLLTLSLTWSLTTRNKKYIECYASFDKLTVRKWIKMSNALRLINGIPFSQLSCHGNFKWGYYIQSFTSSLIKTSCDELSHVHIGWTISGTAALILNESVNQNQNQNWNQNSLICPANREMSSSKQASKDSNTAINNNSKKWECSWFSPLLGVIWRNLPFF